MEVLIEPGQFQVARELVVGIGKQLGQRAMYFEVREGAEIIDIEEVDRSAECLRQRQVEGLRYGKAKDAK